jgi:hypothetical protein
MNTKLLLPIFVLIALSFSTLAIAVCEPTIVEGKVYSGNTIYTPPVEGAKVDVTCDSATLTSDPTDANGFYYVTFNCEECGMDDNVQACVGSVCSDTVMVSEWLPNPLNIVGVDIFNVPEFGALAASVAVTGGVLGFLLLRKRN